MGRQNTTVDRSWFEDALDDAQVDAKTAAALQQSVVDRGAQARKLLRDQKTQRRNRAATTIAAFEKMYPISHWRELMDFSDDAIRTWIKAGELGAHWIKGEYRVTATAMSSFLQAQEKKRG